MQWAYGITTVPERNYNYLEETVASLKHAGFTTPTLFVDGPVGDFSRYGLPVVQRYSKVQAFGNWWLSLNELWIRNPKADRFAIFQDDFVTYKGLRDYLDSCSLADNQYWNLLTFPENEVICPRGQVGWFLSNQKGRGAVALVFSAGLLQRLLGTPQFIQKPRDESLAFRSIDGTLANTMARLEVTELIHFPTLVYHTGDSSSIGNLQHPKSRSFQGRDWDARQLIGAKTHG